MTINWWTLALQAINVIILIWLLTRVFWRPVSKAIAARQEAAKTLLRDAKASKDEAASALEEVTKTRHDMANEREKLLAEAREKAAIAAKTTLGEAAKKAETVLKAAQKKRDHDAAIASAKTVSDAADLAVDIARKLLSRFEPAVVQSMFLDLLITAIGNMEVKDRTALSKTAGEIDLVSAAKLDNAAKTKISKAVGTALGGTLKFNFVTDPELIAGLELRSAHFVLNNSWKADLIQVQKAVKDAA